MSLRSARPAFLLALLVAAPPGAAQKAVATAARSSSSADVCALGEAEAELDAGGVRARLYNIGGLFWRGREPLYEVPKGSGRNAIHSGGLWLGGFVDGELRFAGTTYGARGEGWEFWPGPLDDSGAASAGLCAAFDRIWTVTTADLAAYHASGVAADDLAAWPVGAGAPFFVDADGDGTQGAAEPTVALRPGDAGYDVSRTIDLAAGERPAVSGAQTAWWVMNDLGGEHAWSLTEPLGVEVRVTAWTLADDARPALYDATFYRYDILHRGDAPLLDARAGLFTDADLGDFNDDYVHADPGRSMLVFYNADEDDGGGGGYGTPPAIGIDLLTGADVGMHFYGGGSYTSDPGDGEEAFGHLVARWRDGTPLRVGNDGYRTDGPETTWSFSADPVARAFWSEENMDGEGTPSPQRERKGVIAAALGALDHGVEATIEAAYLFAQGGSRLDSVERLRAASDAAQAGYADGSLHAPNAATPPPAVAPPPSTAPTLSAPAAGAAFGARPVTFDWAPVPGANGYVVQLSLTEAFSDPDGFRTAAPPFELGPEWFAPNRTEPVYWRVVPTNDGSAGPPSEVRAVTLYRYVPGPLTIDGGSPAFVEVVGPGGVDPCGPEASSTGGCAEVFGNAIYSSSNSTGDYRGVALGGPGPEASVGPFAPNEFEVRFTAEGSVAYYPFSTGALVRVPFEVWDVGAVTPGEANDPTDDVRLVPALFADPPEGGGEPVECVFGYVGAYVPGFPATQRIYAYYGDYAAFAAAAAPLVEADPDGCPASPATDGVRAHVDFDRRPLQRFALVQTSEREPADLEGTVIRFYTVDRQSVDTADGPAVGAPELAVFPNPSAARATVAFRLDAPGPARLRVVDVLGREVLTLAAGDRPAGPHEVSLDVSRLAAGVYVVVLEAGGTRAARTVTVAR